MFSLLWSCVDNKDPTVSSNDVIQCFSMLLASCRQASKRSNGFHRRSSYMPKRCPRLISLTLLDNKPLHLALSPSGLGHHLSATLFQTVHLRTDQYRVFRLTSLSPLTMLTFYQGIASGVVLRGLFRKPSVTQLMERLIDISE